MFDFIFAALAGMLSFFYQLVPNYAVAIALLTLSVMLLLFPLNAKGMRSMAAMSKLSPELKRIQAKYKNDKVKQNEEVMALFKEHNVTPFGGCLPLLLQMPVLFIMYHVLRGLIHKTKDGTFDPKYIKKSSDLYQALHGHRTMKSFGIDLAESASHILKHGSIVTALPFLVLIAGVVATGYYQQRMISKRNPQQASAEDNPMAKQMQQMTKVYPLMYLVFGFTLPAGLNVYFLVSSTFRIAQQAIIYKMDPSLAQGTGAKTVGSREIEPKKPKPTGDKGGSGGSTNGKTNGKPNGKANGSARNGTSGPADERPKTKTPPPKKKRR